jgi:hypothetical protein
MPSLPYQEPDAITIVTQASFLLLLNIAGYVINHALYCGLLGQILLGIAFGAPGGNLLTENAQSIAVQFGYLGLILLVYEGGLSVPLGAQKANIGISLAVALVGIVTPIALSFVLQPLLHATPLQAFAAGAALCSTSLGTTFTLLEASGLTTTRIGSVLSTAAMTDDVVGLVMIQIIANLRSGSGTVRAATVVRPVFVSLAFSVLVPLFCHFILRHVRHCVPDAPKLRSILSSCNARFLIHTLLLFGLVAAAAWSGTSVLFTAYIAGVSITWWDSLEKTHSPESQDTASSPDNLASTSAGQSEAFCNELSGVSIYSAYFKQPVEILMKPLFFVSFRYLFMYCTATDRTGKHWLLNTHYQSVPWARSLAWASLYHSHDIWKACMRCLPSSYSETHVQAHHQRDEEARSPRFFDAQKLARLFPHTI